jgi:hypothetical protein
VSPQTTTEGNTMDSVTKAGSTISVPTSLIDQLKGMAKGNEAGAGSAPQQVPGPTPRPSPGPVITT